MRAARHRCCTRLGLQLTRPIRNVRLHGKSWRKYRIYVRIPIEQAGHWKAQGFFDFKEHLASIGLARKVVTVFEGKSGRNMLAASLSANDPNPTSAPFTRAAVSPSSEERNPHGITFSFDFDVRDCSDGAEHY